MVCPYYFKALQEEKDSVCTHLESLKIKFNETEVANARKVFLINYSGPITINIFFIYIIYHLSCPY